MPSTEQIWTWLDAVCDPEIPAVSVTDLGIVRQLAWEEHGTKLVVTITPTYSGCPANDAIASDIESALRDHGITELQIKQQLAPPWTTDWISEQGKERLRIYGIAPPVKSHKPDDVLIASTESSIHKVPCPRCASTDTKKISQFGSTPCKAQYKCLECLEPFDYFKCH